MSRNAFSMHASNIPRRADRPARHIVRRTLLLLCVSAVLLLLCASASWGVRVALAQKPIKRDDARKLIAAASVLELNKDAVTIREISPPGAASASVVAGVKLGFHFTKDAEGLWRVVEVRTGDRRWESFDLLARAAGGDAFTSARAELDGFAAELAALGDKKRAASNDTQTRQADEQDKRPAGDDRQPAGDDKNEPPKELKRGALSIRNPAGALPPSGSSAVVELEVETSVDFARDARGRWQVARVRVAGRDVEAFDAFERALDAEKRTAARTDLEALAAALEAYRRARGFYVVAETGAALVDHLNPRYTTAYIRFDPWHRPYEYEGTRERYTLRSVGADGKANTPDDVTVEKR